MLLNEMNKKVGIFSCVNDFKKFEKFKKSLTQIKNYSLISINNIDNKFTIPSAFNHAIQIANFELLIFVHQDVIFPENWLHSTIKQIEHVEIHDSAWGVVGIMGVRKNGFFAGNIIDPHTKTKMGNLPCEVAALDEVCLILRKDSNLRFDESLGGFHLYGADICLQAQQKGMKCYAIDAPLTHLSGGKLDHSFWEMAEKLKNKWSQIQNCPNTIETTCGVFRLKNNFWSVLEYNFKILRRKIIRRIQKRHIRISSE